MMVQGSPTQSPTQKTSQALGGRKSFYLAENVPGQPGPLGTVWPWLRTTVHGIASGEPEMARVICMSGV